DQGTLRHSVEGGELLGGPSLHQPIEVGVERLAIPAIAVERFELEEGHEVGADGRGLDRIHGGFQLEYEVANELPQPADRFLALLHHGAFDIGKRPPRKALESRPASL